MRYSIRQSQSARPVRDQLIGDRLARLDRALGRHPDAAKALTFSPERQWIARQTTHLDIMGRAKVHAQLRKWLAWPICA
jgi:hypothetical protein